MTDDQINAAVSRVANEFASVVDNDRDATLVMIGLVAHFCVCFGASADGLARAVNQLRSATENSPAALAAKRGRLQ